MTRPRRLPRPPEPTLPPRHADTPAERRRVAAGRGQRRPPVGTPPAVARLPDGFAVQLDARVRRLNGGQALLGGAPMRLLRLSGTAADLLAGGSALRVRDRTTAALARRLLDTGVAHPRPEVGPAQRGDVTVVVPVRDRPQGLDRLLAAVRRTAGAVPVLVVDDGSRDDGAVRQVCARHDGAVIRHEVARGPAAARNAGMATATTPYVAFVDSDCVPLAGWLDILRSHLDDPLVAAAAPRIVASELGAGWLAPYERAVSSLDRGAREGPVQPHSGVPYVPSAALLVRRAALGHGYDEAMHVAEDVDLVWRLVAAGWRVRYVPAARVAHEHRTAAGAWARRRAFYGTGAAPLAARHGAAVAPVVLSPWSAAAWLALLAGGRRGMLPAAAILGWATARLACRLDDLGPRWPLAARLVGLGSAFAGRQLASAAVRHYWPVTLLAAAASRRMRWVIAAAGVLDGLVGWWPHRSAVSLPAFVLIRRLDDLCYGAGLWLGVCRSRSPRALRPELGQALAGASVDRAAAVSVRDRRRPLPWGSLSAQLLCLLVQSG